MPAKTTKTTKTVETNENIKTNTEPSLSDLIAMVSALTQKINDLTTENQNQKDIIGEMQKTIDNKEEVAPVVEAITDTSREQVSNPYYVNGARKVRVYHMQELIGGTATVLKLTNGKRRLTKIGELSTFSVEDFEELKGSYRNFFDRGILAVDVADIDLAQMYDLPVYDSQTKSSYNSKVLKEIKNYNQEQLKDFYMSLSENNKKALLSFWLGKVYEKEPGYYDEDRMRWLNSMSDTQTFSTILMEIEENKRREKPVTVNAR